jgi:hypothetical protein
MENTINKTSLRGKTHFDVPSSMWTPTMMLNYIKFQESYNDGWLVLSENSLLRFAYLHEGSEKQQKVFSKVYKKFHDSHWKTIRNQKLIEKHKMIENNLVD